MTTPQSDLRRAPYRWWAGFGYLVFATGSVLGIWLAWRVREPESGENPIVVLLLVWVIAGVTHIFVRKFWRACVFSASGSALGYVVLAVALTPNPILNEMFGAGIIGVGLFGFFFAMLMGLPVTIYRRSREAPGRLVSRIPSPTVVGTIGMIFGVVGIVGSLDYFSRPAILEGAKRFAETSAVRERLAVPPWFKLYCLAIGTAAVIASVLYLWGSLRLLRLREHGATLFMVGASTHLLVGASIVTAGLVSSSAAIREDRFMALGSVVTNAVLLFFGWRWRQHGERARPLASGTRIGA